MEIRPFLIPVAFGLGSVLAGFAAAQDVDAGATPEEMVIVTARKRAEDLQSVPLAITVVTEQTIEQMGIRRTEDLVKITPGLTFAKGLGGADRRPDIRGLSPVRGRSTVAVLVDGVDMTSDSGVGTGGGQALNMDLFELERIEVVRGPQSALYGRNAFAGAISYITKKPTTELDGTISAEFAEHGIRIVKGSISGPLIGESLLGRVGLAHSASDARYLNAENGHPLGENETNAVAIALTWLPADSFEANLRFDYSDQEAGQAAIATIANNACAPVDESATVPVKDIELCNLRPNSDYSQIFLGTVPEVREGDIRLSDDHFFGIQNEQKRITLSLDWSLPFADFVSVTSYADFDETNDYDLDQQPDGVPTTGTGTVFPADVSSGAHNDTVTDRQVLFQDARLSGQIGENIFWMFGGEFYTEDWDRQAYVRYTAKLERPAANLPPGKESTLPGRRLREIDAWGVYGTLDFDLADNWTFSTAIRYQREDVSFFSESISFSSDPQVVGDPSFFSESNSFDSVDPRFSLEFAATDNSLIYVSAAKGSKPGGFTAQTALRDESRRFDTETMWTYELGAKSTWWDRALLLNGALFYIDDKNKQVSAIEGFPPQTYTDNIGRAEIWGFELELVTTPLDGLTLTTSYAWTDAKYVEYFYESAKGGIKDMVFDPDTGGIELVPVESDPDFDVAGKTLINVPKHALHASAEYAYPVNNELDLISRVDYAFRSGSYLDTQNFTKFDDRHTIDLMAGVRHERVEAYLYVENLLDDRTPETGISFINFADDLQTLNVIYPAAQRTIGARIRMFF